MRRLIKGFIIIAVIFLGFGFQEEVHASGNYVNETVNVSFTFKSSIPVAAQITFESNVSLSPQVAMVGNPVEGKYVSTISATTSFKPSKVGNYTITASVKASDNNGNPVSIATQTKTVNVTEKPAPKPTPPPSKPTTPTPSKPAPSDTRSSNNFLRTLTVSEGSLGFSRNTTSYRVVVENSVTSIRLGASAEDSKSTVTGLGSKSLDVYDNNMTVNVRAENGSVKAYSINVVRKDADGNEKKPENNNNLESLAIEGCEIDFSKDKLVYNCEVSNLVDSLTIETNPEDTKATVKTLNNDKLVNGNNEVKIIVTAENKEEKEYVINVIRSSDAPSVKIEDLSAALKKITVDEIIVEPSKDGIISKDVLLEIKNANKVMYVYSFDEDENILYQWKFDGKNLSDLSDVNTSLNFDSKNVERIDKLSNFAKGYNLVLANNPNLPKGIELGVNVEGEYADETLLNLYYYDAEKNSLSVEHKDLEIVDGYVWMPLDHASEYLLTPASISNISTLDNTLLISTIILAIALVLSFGIILLQKQRFSKIKRNINLNK